MKGAEACANINSRFYMAEKYARLSLNDFVFVHHCQLMMEDLVQQVCSSMEETRSMCITYPTMRPCFTLTATKFFVTLRSPAPSHATSSLTLSLTNYPCSSANSTSG